MVQLVNLLINRTSCSFKTVFYISVHLNIPPGKQTLPSTRNVTQPNLKSCYSLQTITPIRFSSVPYQISNVGSGQSHWEKTFLSVLPAINIVLLSIPNMKHGLHLNKNRLVGIFQKRTRAELCWGGAVKRHAAVTIFINKKLKINNLIRDILNQEVKNSWTGKLWEDKIGNRQSSHLCPVTGESMGAIIVQK